MHDARRALVAVTWGELRDDLVAFAGEAKAKAHGVVLAAAEARLAETERLRIEIERAARHDGD